MDQGRGRQACPGLLVSSPSMCHGLGLGLTGRHLDKNYWRIKICMEVGIKSYKVNMYNMCKYMWLSSSTHLQHQSSNLKHSFGMQEKGRNSYSTLLWGGNRHEAGYFKILFMLP